MGRPAIATGRWQPRLSAKASAAAMGSPGKDVSVTLASPAALHSPERLVNETLSFAGVSLGSGRGGHLLRPVGGQPVDVGAPKEAPAADGAHGG
jgi:hypothetical protein